MCDGYELKTSAKELLRLLPGLHLRQNEVPYKDAFCPADSVLILTANGAAVQGEAASWGLVGSFLDQIPRIPPISLRSEGLVSTPFYNRLLRGKRCLIPATAFFDCVARDGAKRKTRFFHPKGQPLLFAAVFDRHPLVGISCAILTLPANESLGGVLERMPLVLSREEAVFWLAEHGEFPTDAFMAIAEPASRLHLTFEAVIEAPPSPQLSFQFA